MSEDVGMDFSILDIDTSSSTLDSISAEPQDVPNTEKGSVDNGSEASTPRRDVGSTTVQDDLPYTDRERQLLARIEELSGRNDQQSVLSNPPDSQNPFTPQEHNFLADIDIDEVLSTSEGLNSLLLSVYNKAIQEASRMSAENIMRGLPGTMSSYFNQQLSMRELVTDFYKNHPDLEGMKKTVAMVANEVANENPELTAEEVFKETGIRTRKLLGIADTPSRSQERPTLHTTRGNGGRQRIQSPELDGLAREIHDLIT